MNVHPAAAVWPMLPDDELDALAASIGELGLLEPIVVWVDDDEEEWLLDGRNRLAACERAEVKPVFVRYDGDPVAFVLARNDRRRHMRKEQRAMAAWETAASSAYSLSTRGVADAHDLNAGMVAWAKVVHDHAPGLVGPVIAGARPLKDAYDEARQRRDAASGEKARLERLPAELATKVREGDLTLQGAEAEHRQRETDRADRLQRNVGYLTRIAEGWQLAQTLDSMVDLDDALDALDANRRALIDDVLTASRRGPQ